MKNLRMLGALAGGAILIAGAYGAMVGNIEADISFDSDEDYSTRHSVEGGKAEFYLKDGEQIIKAKWRDNFGLDDTAMRITTVDRKLTIEVKENDTLKKVIFKNNDDDLERSFYINDKQQSQTRVTDDEIDALTLTFLRASGLKAEDRVNALLTQGGASSVIKELPILGSEQALISYIKALSETTQLQPSEIDSLANALSAVESDHHLRHSIEVVLENQTITSQTAPSLIKLADSIENDHDIRKLVEVFAERPLNAESYNIVIDLMDRIEGGHDLRKSIEAIFNNENLTDSAKERILHESLPRLEDDHQLYLVLALTAKNFIPTEKYADGWFTAYSRLSSSHDHRRALSELITENELEDEIWHRAINAVSEISSDHDQRIILEEIAELAPRNDRIVKAYLDVANDISADRDRKVAIAAIQ